MLLICLGLCHSLCVRLSTLFSSILTSDSKSLYSLVHYPFYALSELKLDSIVLLLHEVTLPGLSPLQSLYRLNQTKTDGFIQF